MKIIATTLVLASLTGCATNPLTNPFTSETYNFIVDRPSETYTTDHVQCHAHARQLASVAEQAVAGAAAGALVGALFAAAVGAKGYRNEAAMAYGLAGGLGGAVKADTDKRSIVRNCLQGRGHNILN